MTCKHNPDHVVTKYDIDGIPEPCELSYSECLDCGVWLPLGPSNDDSEAVRVEIRAAELATLRGGVYCSNDAWSGWWAHARGWESDPPIDCQAAWLAREIWDHENKDDPCPDGPNCGCPQHMGAPDADDDE